MYVVTGDEMHQIDRYTMNEIGLTEVALMESAGQAFCRQLEPTLKKQDKIIILIGSGNNGGDGFVIGRILKEDYNVDVWVIPPEHKIRGAALAHMKIYEKSGYDWFSYAKQREETIELNLNNYTIVIDSLLGTGVQGTPRSPYRELITKMNETNGTIISVDIPSGIPAHEGEVRPIGVKAHETYTFQSAKMSAFCFPTANYYGKISVLPIGIPNKAFTQVNAARKVISEDTVKNTLAKRMPDAHKGSVGKGLIIGGAKEMVGAPVLTTEASLRSGVGLVTLAVPDVIHPIVSQKVTEALFLPLATKNGQICANEFISNISLNRFDCIAIGPGLGRKERYKFYPIFSSFHGPIIIDADGLYHLSKELREWRNGRPEGPTIITPHPGEMAMLTGLSIQEVEKQRFKVSKEFAMKFQMYVVLKGPYTIVTTPSGEQWVNTTGNASLAKGGSGDVLTGMIVAFLLQHHDTVSAITNAVYIHGKAADELVKTYDIFSVTATDLINELPVVIRSIRYR
ncbi:NAD(P)H-hydrate dehydratase [Evansella sp. AB-rgal1]|uniref:NAD(P)H-hydrate dehydratase n=1 Tax=Evansella sp. AB-rgal1 TaxID=3242696 RepID=UPI00359D8804